MPERPPQLSPRIIRHLLPQAQPVFFFLSLLSRSSLSEAANILFKFPTRHHHLFLFVFFQWRRQKSSSSLVALHDFIGIGRFPDASSSVAVVELAHAVRVNGIAQDLDEDLAFEPQEDVVEHPRDADQRREVNGGGHGAEDHECDLRWEIELRGSVHNEETWCA